MTDRIDNPSRCPNADELRALLDERLDSAAQSRITAHLEACDSCRGQLDRLAGESAWWDDAHLLAAGDSPLDARNRDGHAARFDPHDAPETQADHPPRRPVRGTGSGGLPFLEPTEEQGCIGRFGPYEVLGVVGRGGMGVVLKAFDPGLHRVVAVKVLAPQLAAGAAARRRFVREARAAASVCHEHVVTIHAVDERAGWPYLVMQYVGGKSLQDRIDLTGPLDVKEILRIAFQTASGLAAAHAQGLVHRDIKPANILLENGIERVKITDFGLARAVDDPSLTQAGVVAGTPQYMSPEQARGEAVDHRADLFSLGCVMYAMATSRPPFRGDSTMAVLRKVSDEAPRSIRDSNSEIPGWLEAIIMKLLAKAPADRYQTATEVANLLADHLARLQQGRSSAESTFSLPADLLVRPEPALLPAMSDVGPQKPHPVRSIRPRLRTVAAIGLLGLLVVGTSDSMGYTRVAETLAVVLRLRTAEGTLALEIDDPDAEVSIDGDDLVIRGSGLRELKLKAGNHWVESRWHGIPVRQELVSIERNGRRLLKVEFEPDQFPDSVEMSDLDRLPGLANPLQAADRIPLLRLLHARTGEQRIAAEHAAREAERAARDLEHTRARAHESLAAAEAELARATELAKRGQFGQSELDTQREQVVQERLKLDGQKLRTAVLTARLDLANRLKTEAEQQQAELTRAIQRAERGELGPHEMDRLWTSLEGSQRAYRDALKSQITVLTTARSALAESRLASAHQLLQQKQEQLARAHKLYKAQALSQQEFDRAELAATTAEHEAQQQNERAAELELLSTEFQTQMEQQEADDLPGSDRLDVLIAVAQEPIGLFEEDDATLVPAGSSLARALESFRAEVAMEVEHAQIEALGPEQPNSLIARPTRRMAPPIPPRPGPRVRITRSSALHKTLEAMRKQLDAIQKTIEDPHHDPRCESLRRSIKMLENQLRETEAQPMPATVPAAPAPPEPPQTHEPDPAAIAPVEGIPSQPNEEPNTPPDPGAPQS